MREHKPFVVLALLANAEVRFREPHTTEERVLTFTTSAATRRERIASFDATRYDHLRILSTELNRVASTGGTAEIRIGRHILRVGQSKPDLPTDQ